MKKIFILLALPFLIFSQVDYNTEIQPILDANCVSCHQGSAAYYGGLSLTSYNELIEGGYSAGGIISTSLLENYISTGYMPPYGSGNNLTSEEVDLIIQWISEGALEENSSTGIVENNNTKSIVKTLDFLGRTINQNKQGIFIYLYENGEVEKRYSFFKKIN